MQARVVQAASDLATWLDMSNTLNFSPLVTAAVSISMAADSLKVIYLDCFDLSLMLWSRKCVNNCLSHLVDF